MTKMQLARMAIVSAVMEIYDNANYEEVSKMVDEKVAKAWQEIMDKLAGKE